MTFLSVRKALESDRSAIAKCIAEGFENDFFILCKDTGKVAMALQNGLKIKKFYVAEAQNKVIGVIAISDRHGRAMSAGRRSCCIHFGFIKGIIAGSLLYKEFGKSLSYPEDTGYLEFVTVRSRYQGKGVATAMLNHVISEELYSTYILNVTTINTPAIQCYKKFGFTELKKERESHRKQKEPCEKISMQYKSSTDTDKTATKF